MAEILVHLKGRGTDDTDYRPGDIVDVKPDGWTWGVRESKASWVAAGRDPAQWPGTFGIVKIPDLAVAKALRALHPDISVLERPTTARAVEVYSTATDQILATLAPAEFFEVFSEARVEKDVYFKDPVTGRRIDDIETKEVLIRRRGWHINIATVPAAIKRTIQQDGEVTVSLAKAKAFVLRKRDGLTVDLV